MNSAQIKSLALSLGFDVCGITDARRLPEEEEKLRLWLREGRHGGMNYLEDFEARAGKFWENFPDAKSTIVVGVNYYSTKRVVTGRQEVRPLGRVARYAWGKDYHRVIGKRLEIFRDELSKLAGRPIRADICVDTKPLLERSLAERAGLGFIGKQSQLLNPKFGPWLFLAELVTNLALEADLPYIGSCGRCTICIDECPTEAILPEGGIDARRCIAYLTIEHKGEIAGDLQPLMGGWVFGCDICLQVCPYASKGKETNWTELKAEAGFGPELDLVKLLEISSNRVYEKNFVGTAILRARRKQLVRNAKIVLKNLEAYENERNSRPRMG